VHVEAGVALEPARDRRMLMGGVIVGDDVDVEIGRGLVIDGFEKGEPLLMTMTRRQTGDQLAFDIVERCAATRNHNVRHWSARNRVCPWGSATFAPRPMITCGTAP
jgi:hypothetical protein